MCRKQLISVKQQDLILLFWKVPVLDKVMLPFLDYCDVSMYVMTPEYGAASQLEKINMLDYADLVCINKFDKAGALDALA